MLEILKPSYLVIISINLLTLGFYYYFYRFHFYRHTDSNLQYTAFAFSIFCAGLALFLQLLTTTYFPIGSVYFRSFFTSSFLEESVKLFGIYIFFRKNQNTFSVTDGIFYGIVLGGGFGMIENILYLIDTGLWSQVLRTITALPIHMMNGGLLGAFLITFLFSKNNTIKWLRLSFGFFFSVGIHGLYNLSMFTDLSLLIFLPICILILFFLLELTIARSRILLPGYVLNLLEMSLEEYEILSRHNRHEGWIQNVQKHISNDKVKLFRFPNLRNIVIVSFFLLLSMVSIFVLDQFPEWISKHFGDLHLEGYFVLFVIYPGILGFMIFFAGFLNPYFFRDRMLSVPLFSSVDLHTEIEEENTSLFYISLNTFYIPTTKIYSPGTKVKFDLWLGVDCFASLGGLILWSRENEEGNCGAMCRLDTIPIRFLLRWNLIRFKQNIKNLFVRRSVV
ncbi:PrsW family glutamic-type intramembrane protease [Leptospira sp. 96542]|nr:PrsW family glutamic-type intramembrane protease [Leptospira sp. 96542]